MSRPVHCFLILLFLNTGAGTIFPDHGVGGARPESAGVARAPDRRPRHRQRRADVPPHAPLRSPGARPRARPDADLDARRRRPPVPGDRTLIRFAYPNDIKGTAFLVWESPSGDDERFLYLPSLGRVRRIAGSEAQESFVGSDFTYEDIGGREFEDYTYTMLSEAETWTGRRRIDVSGLPARIAPPQRQRALPARRLDRSQGQLRRRARGGLRQA